CVRIGPQLHGLLQSSTRGSVSPTVARGRPGETQTAGLEHRHDIAARGSAAGDLPYARRDLLASVGEGSDDNGKQHGQRLAHGRRLARQIVHYNGEDQMTRRLPRLAANSALLIALLAADPAAAQKPGGILTMYHDDSPPSMSIHEEVTVATVVP